MYLKTKIIKCPECGSPIRYGNTSEISDCPHCKTPVLIKIEDGYPQYILKSNLEIKDTTAILLSRLRHYLIADDVIAKSKIISRSIYYIPFYYITGYKCGEHILQETDRLTNEKKEDTKVIQSGFKYSTLAARPPGWGKLNINLTNKILDRKALLPLTSFSDKDAVLIKPDSSIKPLSEISKQITTHNENIKSEVIVDNCIIIYYPILRVVLKYRTNIYHYSIDGLTGEIIYGIAPESLNNRFIPMALAAFFTSFFSGGIFSIMIKSIFSGTLALWIFVLPVLLLFILTVFFFVYIAYLFYRNYGEVVIEGDNIEINKLNIPEETKIERILKPVFEFVDEIIKNNRNRLK